MLLRACSACLAGFVCVWPSASPHSPQHAEPHAAMSHHTNTSPEPSSHQSDALLKLYPSTSTRSPRRVTRYVHSCLCEDPSDKHNSDKILPSKAVLSATETSRTRARAGPDQSSSAEPLGSGATCSWRRLAPSGCGGVGGGGLFIDAATAKQWAKAGRNQTKGLVPGRAEERQKERVESESDVGW